MKESLELIRALAETLGTSVEYLITIFAVRAPYEWFPVAAWLLGAVIGLLFAYYGYKKVASPDKEPVVVSGLLVAGICLLFSLGYSYWAIMANASPEAYAVEEILKAARLER